MKQFIYCTIILVTIASCNKNLSQDPTTGAFTAISLNPELEVTIQLNDYFMNTMDIDSIEKVNYGIYELNQDKNILSFLKNKAQVPPIGDIGVWIKGERYGIPFYKSPKQKHSFTYPYSTFDKKVKIKGEFTNWIPQELKLEYDFQTIKFDLEPGKYQYVLIYDGKEITDPNNAEKISNGMGGFNSVLTIKGYKEEKPLIQSHKLEGEILTIRTKGEITDVLVSVGNQTLERNNITIKENKIEVNIPQNHHNGFVKVYAATKHNRSNDLTFPYKNGKIVATTQEITRQDFHSQVMYFLMVDRFYDGNKANTKKVDNDSILPKANYYGGDLEGVLAKIKSGYFTEMKINTIWLSPITQNPEGAYGLYPEPVTKFSGYHGYWPISNTKIDHRFGTDEVFKELIAAAHEQGINVILDYVANHVHEEHPLYKEHPEWATPLYLADGSLNTERWDDHRLTTWFDTFMPTLDFSRPEVVEAMTDSATHWVTNYDLDGFRHDATKHVNLEFWRTLTKKIKNRTNRPIYQIGETYGSPELIASYLNPGMIDGQFDFNLYGAAVDAFAKDSTDFTSLKDELERSLKYYGSNHLMGNITGNQDKARFISYASGDVKFDEDAKHAGWNREIGMSDSTAYDKLALLHAFNLSIPGIPCIYYGDEYGSIGGNDPDNRKMMKFNALSKKEDALRTKVKTLVKQRRESMALLYGSTEIIRADQNLFILKRKYLEEEVFCILNKSKNDAVVTLPNQEQVKVPSIGYVFHTPKN